MFLLTFVLKYSPIIVWIIHCTDGHCNRDVNGNYLFGPNCDFICHCLNKEQCDGTTGECSSGCDWEWAGQGCQYTNKAYKPYHEDTARHIDNVDRPQYAKLANDNDLSTCSETGDENTRRSSSPWWKVWFPKNITFKQLTILTRTDKLDFFRSFNVTVEFVPEAENTNKGFYPEDPQLCYEQRDRTVESTTIPVTCEKPLVGNQLRITLGSIKTQLVICDIRIFGCPTGFYGEQCKQECSANCLNQNCNHVDGNCTDGCKDGWKSPKCQECVPGFYGEQCNHRCNANCMKQNCDHVDGKCTDGCKDGWTSPNCDQECTAGSYGAQCSQRCSTNCRDGDKYCSHVDGKCINGCEDGWTNPQCSQVCTLGFYGAQCNKQCNANCLNQTCTHVNGTCTDGCKDGWTSPQCDQRCAAGSYGAQCKKSCSTNCLNGDMYCNHVDGNCSYGCKDGWTNRQCGHECPAGSYGAQCKQRCSVNCFNGNGTCNHVNGSCTNGCKDGWTNSQCNRECPFGKYGAQCNQNCSPYCLLGSKDCNHVDGNCPNGCKSGWTNPQCSKECTEGTYGTDCRHNCSAYCFTEGLCDKSSGRCQGGCKPGYTGETCDQKCRTGSYGERCEQHCSEHCLNGKDKCDHVNGDCMDGCQDGWTFPKCEKECENGTYGKNCAFKCTGNCLNDDICIKSTGNCPRGCKPGYKEKKCEQMCPKGDFGMECSQKCSEHCIDVCNNVDGTCAQCEHGWKGVNCTAECDDGSYGKHCSNSCGNCKDGTFCHKTNGTCIWGCTEGFTGHDCVEALKLSEAAAPIPGIIGGIVVLLVVVAALIGVVSLFTRRRTRKQKNRNSNVDKVASTEEQSAESQGFNTYSNAAMIEDNRTGKQVSGKVNAKNVRNGKGMQMEMMQAKDKLKQGKEEDNADVYYNTGPLTKQRSQSAIRISDFGAYVKSGLSNKDFFFNEFQKIPYGSVHSTQIAKKPGNAKKNRYKDMYAYDHSRVILNKLADDPDSDYINASYIRGNVAERAYIAAQGPTDFNVNDFWRMVLEKDVHTIVMVTNLVEETKMKCIQYWAEVGDTKTYGPISIYTERECVFAEYTVRKFTVTQADKPEKSHKVKHYNYTAWPDKDVPKSTSSLLHFWRRVRQNEKTRPWLVHCSAGVGRTGTFVAIDVLYDQGKDLGFLDVYQCVRDLRDQRVNMVQTKEQYKYLHSIMTEIFVLPSQPIKIEELNVVYRDLKEVDRATGKTKLLLEYETLRDEPSNALQVEESSAASASTHKAESIYSCAKLSENKRKNRYDNILASNEYRPFLATDVKGCTNYINAVYISSYCDLHGFILTQTPMKHTVVDLYRLILEQEVKVVVTFDDHTVEEVGKCFPEDGSVTPGPFTMTFVSESCNQNFNTRIHTLKYQKKEQKVLQVIFKQWQTEVPVPPDPYKMYSFLQDIEKLQKQHEQKPVILSCLNGAERSGLIAVLINILERARFDGEVSIPQVIRQLRVRRQQIIPNFDQYKLCYDVLLCHAETNATYANM